MNWVQGIASGADVAICRPLNASNKLSGNAIRLCSLLDLC